jgi:spore maturation protein SpmB
VTSQPSELPDLVDPHASLGVALRRDLPRGIRAGLETFWSLAKAMIPAYALALVLQKLGVVTALAHVAQPVMSLVGLPGSAAVPLVLGYVLNVYAAVGAMTALHLTGQQITVLMLAVLIGHNLLVEGAVLRKAGMSGLGFGVLRAVSGLLAAGVANLLMKAFS